MSRPSSDSLSILLVEHEAAYVRTVRAALAGTREKSFTIEHVGGMQAALDLLSSGSFDALLLDLRLPEAPGLEGLREVVVRFPALPIVALIAWDFEPLGLEALQHGAQDYIVKGEEEKRLAKAVRFAVERKRAMDALRRLEKAVDTMQLGVSITDNHGRIVYVNRAEAELHGYTVDEMLGMDARSLSPRSDWRPLPPQELIRIQKWKRERVRSRKDGSVFPVQLMSDLVKDETGRPLGVVTTCEDISERRRAEGALRESEERYALAVRGANDGIWDWSLRDQRMYYSARWKEMLGYQEDELSESPDEWLSRIHPEDGARVWEKIVAHLEGTSPHFEDEHRVRHKDGRYLWVLSRGFAVRGEDGRPTRMAGAQTDVTDRRAHDALTGLPNRALMTQRIEQALARHHRRPEDGFAVLFLDLDYFKAVNDTLGHAAGDALLMEVARRLERCLRPGDVVGRLAGDEFGVLIDRLGDVDEAVQVAQRIRQELRLPLSWEGYPLRLSASIGIALASTGYDKADQMLREADAAMYQAKAAGRDRFEIFDAAMRDRLRLRRSYVDGIRHALSRGELALVFQPIVAMEDGQLVGLEALLRWDHPEGRLLSPPQVLELAQETGQLPRVEAWALREACRQARRWREFASHAIAIAVNLSRWELRRSELPEEVLSILAQEELDPSLLWIDFNDQSMRDNLAGPALVERLRASGVRTFLDDFGAGDSPLSVLATCPLDGLKLDASVVASITQDMDAPLLRAIFAAARTLGLPVVAEGVETVVQRERLLALGCALGQGTFFSPPLSISEVDDLVASEGWPSALTPAGALSGSGSSTPSPRTRRPRGKGRRGSHHALPTSS